MSHHDVIIIGAGLAGLSCARHLVREGLTPLLLEASDAAGGRVRTDRHDGFLLDRGFQVLLTAYPEALAQLDYDALQLCAFQPGALVRQDGSFVRLTDPWREPGTFLNAIFSPVGKLGDKIRLARLRSQVRNRTLEEIFAGEETSILQALRRRRFSRRFTERFFKPLIGGALMDTKLGSSSHMLDFLMQMFADGDAAVPAYGMQAIPEQLAAGLPEGVLQLNTKVASIAHQQVVLESGDALEADQIVVATEGPESSRLLGSERTVATRGVCCLYFSCKEPPIDDPMLVLSGSTRGPINNLAVMNLIAPQYAPPGENLVSVTVIGVPSRDDQSVVNMVRTQLKRWYGLVTQEWRLLRFYRIPHGQPAIFPLEQNQNPRLTPGLYVCGDHRATPSIQGALESGRLAAESLLRELRGEPDPAPKKTKSERRLRETVAASDDEDDD